MTNDVSKQVKEHEAQSKKREKLPDDIITVTRGGIEVTGKRKDDEKLIQELLRKENGK